MNRIDFGLFDQSIMSKNIVYITTHFEWFKSLCKSVEYFVWDYWTDDLIDQMNKKYEWQWGTKKSLS